MSKPLLEVTGIGKSFGKLWAVQDLSFSMEAGKIYGFIGPNGAGKTTTMRILATLDVPDTGDAFLNGVSVLEDPRAVRIKVGFMSDQFAPYPHLDVMQYLDFFARAYDLSGNKRIQMVESVAEFCGLHDFKDRPVTGLSKGMGQRVHLAKTLLHDPTLLILDEPANGLDPRARIEFRELLRQLALAGKGILISSHILSELSEICHGVLVIEQGRKVVSGQIDELRNQVQEHKLVELRVLSDPEAVERFLVTQMHVKQLQLDGKWARFDFTGTDEDLSFLLRQAILANLSLIEFKQRKADLEEIFLHKTQGKLQ